MQQSKPLNYLETGVLPSYDETDPLFRSPLFAYDAPRGERKPLRQRFPNMWETGDCGIITLPALRADFRTHRAQVRPLLMVIDGQARVGCSRSKFSKKYLSKSEMTLKNSAATLIRLYKYSYMITFTVAPVYRSYNPLETWGNMAPRISRALDKISSKMQGVFVHVAEAHKDGQPHWHALLFTDKAPEEIGTRFGRRGKTRQIYAGSLYNAVVENWDWGRTDITVVQSKEAVGYCAKYIAKGAKACFENLTSEKELAPEQKKWALTFMGSVASGCRQFAVPQKKKLTKIIAQKWGYNWFFEADPEKEENPLLKDIIRGMREEFSDDFAPFVDTPATREARAASIAPTARFLDGLCTNSPAMRGDSGKVSPYAPARDTFQLLGDDDDAPAPVARPSVKIVRMYSPRTKWGKQYLREFENGQLSVNAFQAFFKKGARVGKGETVWQHLENQRLTGCDDWFNYYLFDKPKSLIRAYAYTSAQCGGKINGYPVQLLHPAIVAYWLPNSPVADYRREKVNYFRKKWQIANLDKCLKRSDEIQHEYVQRQKDKFREKEDRARRAREALKSKENA